MTPFPPSVVIIAGPNGAGKSTAAPQILRGVLEVMEFVNADDIARGLSAFKPESAAIAAGRIMLTRLRELARQRVSFAFETTLSSRTFAPWLKELKEDGYAFHLVYLWVPSAEFAVARVASRTRQGDIQCLPKRFDGGIMGAYVTSSVCTGRLPPRGRCSTVPKVSPC